jgi:thiol-disulfide isomerase/thioredoxin
MLSLYDFKAKYTLLYFFNPLCSHCMELTPEVYKMTMPYAAKGIRVLAVSTETQPDTWKDYIRKNVPAWTCVADFAEQSPLEKTYATNILPNLLLLDENKKIVIRRLPVQELPNVLKMIGN